jgi:hypothetical protein
MVGGPPQMDLYDYKPKMEEWYDKDLPESIRNGQRLTTMTSGQKRFPIAPSKYAFARLKADAWYLHRNRSDAWYFSPAENLRKLIEDRARNAPQPRIEEDMRRRLRDSFKPRGRGLYDRVEALPKIEDIDLRGQRACIVLEPQGQQPSDALREYYEAVSEKNNICVVTGDGSSFANLELAVRRAYGTALAREQMAHNQPDKVREAEDLVAEAEQAVNSTIIGLFNKVYAPVQNYITEAASFCRPRAE